VLPLFVLLAAGACVPMPVFDGTTPEAREFTRLSWTLLLVTGVPALATLLVLLLGVLWRSERPERPRRHQRFLILVPGAIVTPALLFALVVESARTGQVRSSFGQAGDLTIDVIGRQFWWEVRYPEQDIVTANEIHLPTGSSVRLRLSTGDVIHSFWVPPLGGKLDMVPGQVNELTLRVDAPGVFRGHCAEFCGVQHAFMLLEVVSESPEAFARWVARSGGTAAVPTTPAGRRGLEVFYDAECAHCHHVRGLTPAIPTGSVGPDLTHLASRRTLGAGLIANTRGNLGGWILNPQALKPGNHMPDSVLASADLHPLLDFLEGLE
jgi:cytochrome c oxidase subunit 2